MSDKITSSLEKIAQERHSNCSHGVTFDSEAAKDLSVYEVRKRWPRLDGVCPLCGFVGIGYASYQHYIMGDW